MKNFLKSFSLSRKAFFCVLGTVRTGAGDPACAGFAPGGAEAFFCYAQRIIFLSRMRGMALTLDPACAGWRLRRRCIFAALHRATFVLCSFLSSLGKKETNQRKKPPAGQNLPVLRALFCSAVNAFVVRADTYSNIYPSVPLTTARRKRAPSVWRAYRGSPPANFAQPALSTVTLLSV